MGDAADDMIGDGVGNGPADDRWREDAYMESLREGPDLGDEPLPPWAYESLMDAFFGTDNRTNAINRERGTTMPEKSRAELAAELRAAEAALALARAGGDPDAPTSARWPAEPPVSTVLRFNHTFGVPGSTGADGYTYLALNTGAGAEPWYVTGQRGRKRYSWPELCEFIGDTAECEIATGWIAVPVLEHPATEPGDVIGYVEQHFGQPRTREDIARAVDPRLRGVDPEG